MAVNTVVSLSSGTTGTLYTLNDGKLTKHSTVSGNGFYNGRLALAGNVPYVLYNDADYNYVLARYDGGWETILTGDSLAQYIDLAEYDNKLYISYTQGSFPYTLHTLCYDIESGSCSSLGDTIADNACNISSAAGEFGAAVVYRDLNNNSKPTLALWDGTPWKTETLSETSCDAAELTSDGESLHIAVTGESEGLYTYNDGSVSYTGFPELNGSCFTAIPICSQGRIFAGLNTQSEDDYSVYELKDGVWSKLGNSLASEIVNGHSFAYSGGKLYSAYISENGTVIVKCYSLEKAAVPGDVNADGVFNVSDAVMLQRWLTGAGEITDWTAGDLCADGIPDVFDLCMMKRLLITK